MSQVNESAKDDIWRSPLCWQFAQDMHRLQQIVLT